MTRNTPQTPNTQTRRITPTTRGNNKRNLLLTIPAVAFSAALTLGFAAPSPASAAALAPGAVIALQGTDLLWVADAQGVAHLAGDPQALSGRPVDWSARDEATLTELQGTARGAPWLTAALVRLGDAIYLPQFGADGGAPTLLHVKSPADLTLLGVTADAYSQLVLDQASWEARYGYATGALAYDDLRFAPVPDVGAALPPPATVEDAEASSATA